MRGSFGSRILHLLIKIIRITARRALIITQFDNNSARADRCTFSEHPRDPCNFQEIHRVVSRTLELLYQRAKADYSFQ